jgi:hypothetical protein
MVKFASKDSGNRLGVPDGLSPTGVPLLRRTTVDNAQFLWFNENRLISDLGGEVHEELLRV